MARGPPHCRSCAGWLLRHQIEHVAVSSVALMVRTVPLSVVRAIGERLGLVFYTVDAAHRRIALAIKVAFPRNR